MRGEVAVQFRRAVHPLLDGWVKRREDTVDEQVRELIISEFESRTC
ncbi:hypothetical protein [Mesorhizobium sp. WSM3868]|nr:hypothetical protein [Mesorhizobium sp. WSM3868]